MTISEYQSRLSAAEQELARVNALVTLRDSEILSKEREIDLLLEKVRLLQFRHFGKKSEKLGADVQDPLTGIEDYLNRLAEEVQNSSSSNESGDLIHVPAHTKKKPGRRPLPEHLTREEVTVDLPDSEKTCRIHGIALEKIGEERSESLEHIPESFKVIVTVRPKYAPCLCCAQAGGEHSKESVNQTTIKIAPVPPKLIPKSILTPSLLTHITLSKFLNHLPLYRQEQIFSRQGIDLTRGTMAEWILVLGEAVIPLINLLQERLLAGPYLSCDETPLRVLSDHGKRIDTLHYLWIRGRPPDFGLPIYLFEYASSRRAAVAKEILDGFKGILQVDQYAAYNFTEACPWIRRVGCLAHVRRKFWEAQKAMTTKKSIPGRVLMLIKKLYHEDEKVRDEIKEFVSGEDKTKLRRERLIPLFSDLKEFLEENKRKVPPRSATGKAIAYTLNAWEQLLGVLEDDRIRLDNNITENAIRPVAVGRKNYLFCHSIEGAASAANIYSLIATAKANGLNLREYFMRLISELPKAKTLEDFERLLPLAS